MTMVNYNLKVHLQSRYVAINYKYFQMFNHTKVIFNAKIS